MVANRERVASKIAVETKTKVQIGVCQFLADVSNGRK
jgi:hypothetical protein